MLAKRIGNLIGQITLHGLFLVSKFIKRRSDLYRQVVWYFGVVFRLVDLTFSLCGFSNIDAQQNLRTEYVTRLRYDRLELIIYSIEHGRLTYIQTRIVYNMKFINIYYIVFEQVEL